MILPEANLSMWLGHLYPSFRGNRRDKSPGSAFGSAVRGSTPVTLILRAFVSKISPRSAWHLLDLAFEIDLYVTIK